MVLCFISNKEKSQIPLINFEISLFRNFGSI